MKMKLAWFIGVVLVLAGIGAHAGEIPEEVKGLVPIYPKAQVTSCQASDALTQVKLTTKEKGKAVFDWYKKAMTENGWKIIFEKEKKNNYRLVMVKENRQFGFGVHKLPDRDTRFFFSIKKLDAKKTEQKK
jgi:hypothetical protein